MKQKCRHINRSLVIAEPNIACTILVNLSMVRSSPGSACSLFVYPYDRDRIVRRNGALFGEMPGISNANVSPCKSRVANDEEGRNYVSIWGRRLYTTFTAKRMLRQLRILGLEIWLGLSNHFFIASHFDFTSTRCNIRSFV